MLKYKTYFLLAFLFSAAQALAVVDIVLDYGNTSAQNIATYGATFTAAERFWESRLTGYVDQGVRAPGQVTIDVSLGNIDGFGGTLGFAGVTGYNFGGNFIEAATGEMSFDTTDIPLYGVLIPGTFEDVIRHEMGHVLGLGTLWALNGVYVNGTGQYTGAAGLAAFRDEFNAPDATFVPVELQGGIGTANAHWDEGTDYMSNGRSLDDELMSGGASGSMWLSQTSLQSFRDIGFTVIPEPLFFAWTLGLIAFAMSARRKLVSLRAG